MGSEDLDTETNELKEINFYKIVTYQAKNLPPQFKNLIIAPFLNHARNGNAWFKLIDRDHYNKFYTQFIESLLNRPHCQIRMAVLDDETVLGWCLRENKTVHFVFVKKEARRRGICRAVLPKDFEVITHITNVGLNIWGNKFSNARFEPFA
jgi:hypothetical protein